MVSFIHRTDKKDYEIFLEYLKEQYPDMDKYNGIKYTFFDILKMGEREKISEYLHDKCKRMEDIGLNVAAHLKVYDKLVNSDHVQQGSASIMLCCINVNEDEEEEREHDHIYSYNVTDDTTYSLSFVPWSELLDYKVLEENLREIDVNYFIAACLYMMTFWGYDEETIQAEARNIIEDEKNSERVTVDEIMRRLEKF
jgi:hypothetical protein